MGWLIGSESRAYLVDRLTRDYESDRISFRCIRKCFVGYQMLWVLFETVEAAESPDEAPTVTRSACAFLIRRYKDGWGYKEIGRADECPLSYLRYLTVDGPEDREWMERVRAFHARRGTGSKFTVGMTLKLKPGCNPPEVRLVSTRPLVGSYLGTRFRIRRGHIDLALSLPAIQAPADLQAAEAEQMHFGFAGNLRPDDKGFHHVAA